MEINHSEKYKLTEIGLIPLEWEISTIKETVKLINGFAFKPKDWKTQGLPIIRIQNLNDPTAQHNYCDAKIDEKYHVSFGDILFAWSGTKESSFGARVWYGKDALLNQHIFKVIPTSEKLTPNYVLLVLQKVQEDIERKAHGFKSSFVHVKKSDLESVLLPLPPVSEQKAIAQSLTDVDALIAALDKLITKKRNIKQGAMQQLLTGKKRLPGFSGEWEVKRVGDICDFIVPGRNKPKKFEGDIPWITTPDLEDGGSVSQSRLGLCISRDEAKNVGSKIVPAGSVLMSCAGELGIVAFTKNEIVINQQLHAFIPSLIIDALFLLNIIKSQKKYIDGMATKTAVPYINKNNCNSIPISIPPLPEQQAIAQILSDMDAEITVLEKKRDKYKAIKQGMMQELLTGKTRLTTESQVTDDTTKQEV